MKKQFYIFFLLFTPLFAFSQQSKTSGERSRTIDSLLSLLKKDKEDTSKVNHLNLLSRQYINISSYDSVLHYSNAALQLSEKINFNKSIANAYMEMGTVYYLQGDYAKALDYYFKALYLVPSDNEGTTDWEKITAKILSNIGIIYWVQGDLPKALDYYFRALKMDKEIGNKNGISRNLDRIGVVYFNQGDYPKALDYYFRALEVAEEIWDKSHIATLLGNIGAVYWTQGDYPKALDYYFRALKMDEEIGNKNGIAIHLGNIGDLYTKTGKFTEAEKYLKQSLAISDSIDDLEGIMIVNKNLSQLYDTMAVSPQTTLQRRSELYKLSMEHYKKAMTLKDTLFNAESSEKIANIQFRYEQKRKDKIRELEEKVKEQQHQAEVKQQRIIIYSVSVGLFLILALAFFIFKGYRQKQKANVIITQQKEEVEKQKELIEEQKKLVEEKNKDITDSIHYASRIQRALLTSDEYIGRHLKEYFIFFKPKDIVSGDFYWAASVITSGTKQSHHEITSSLKAGTRNDERRFLLAVCDCTGHGVPGAFMSLLNISILNKITLERKIAGPGLILNHAREEIVKALNPEGMEAEGKDGMDCILLSFPFQDSRNSETSEVWMEHAAANNAPLLIREGRITELDCNKMPVGMYSGEKRDFAMQRTELQKGDRVYAYTDGFADQFGGPKGKKFKYKQLNEKLSAISHLSMEEQKTELDRTFIEWKGNLEQVDDVLVIGIKI